MVLTARRPITFLLVALASALACTLTRDLPTDPALRVVQLSVSPESLSLDADQQVRFAAWGRRPNGDSVSGSVSWNATGGRITADGWFTADTLEGDFQVTASSAEWQLTGTSQLRVRGRKHKLVQVVLVPASASLAAGAAQQFAAYGRLGNGDSVAVSVSYAATGGTVTTAGLYTAGSTAGSYRVNAAESGGLADTAAVTITSTPPPPPPPPPPLPEPVASVTVTPATASVQVGATVQLSAVLRDAAGNTLTGRTVTWSSSSSSTAAVSATGLVTGVAAGPATITAASEGKSGTSGVTVTVVPVASVAVSPASASLTVGGTVQLTATPRDGGGNPLSGRAVTWSSSNTAAATVSGVGLVTGIAAGSTTITAASEGRSGTATVSVTAPPVAGECAAPQPGWIWCDDFEQNRLSSYFEYNDAGGSFTRAAVVGRDGSYGMRARFAAGQSSAGALHLAFGRTPQSYFRPVDAGTENYREIYWRMYVRHQAGWVGGGGDKLSRAMIFASSSTWAQAMFAHVWAGSAPNQNYLVIDPASGTDAAGTLKTTQYNDFANMRWLGAARSATPLFDGSHVGQWYCVEVRARLNDAGQSNSVFQLWINGALEAERAGLNWVGAFNAYGINSVFFENYWNAGSPVAQERYFDNIVVSTQRIGC